MENPAENTKDPRFRACVISYPFSRSQKTPVYCLLFNFLEVIRAVSGHVFVITGNIPVEEIPKDSKFSFINFKMETELNKEVPFFISLPVWIIHYVWGQIRISFHIASISRQVDAIIFFLGYDYLLPSITAKLLRKKTILVVTMSSDSIKEAYNPRFYSISQWIESACYSLADYLVVDPQNESLGAKYPGKIKHGARHIDPDLFRITKKYRERGKTVGYIGRFSEEKGIRNYLGAVEILLKKDPDIVFFIGGDGLLHDEVSEKTRSFPDDRVIFTQWIPHLDLPLYFNELALLVIPSYTETGPFTALEAMACGTPVLGTRVGLLSDIISDGTTGFLLENNAPETIAENVLRVLNTKNLEVTADNARKYIENEFTYKSAVKGYSEILDDCLNNQR